MKFVGQTGSRELRLQDWECSAAARMPEHVLLIDDSWVTGAHSQAVAATLKSAGAREVTIFTVARVLHPDWPANKEFIRTRFAGPGFDWTRCPWTGGGCP